jgi:hypothetical protein
MIEDQGANFTSDLFLSAPKYLINKAARKWNDAERHSILWSSCVATFLNRRERIGPRKGFLPCVANPCSCLS